MEYIQIDEDGFVSVYVNKVNQAKLALEELTLKKKELQFYKKRITEEIHQIDGSYKNYIHKQDSQRQVNIIRKFITDVQTLRSETKRKKMANQLASYEQKRQVVETILTSVDNTELTTEKYILENSWILNLTKPRMQINLIKAEPFAIVHNFVSDINRQK